MIIDYGHTKWNKTMIMTISFIITLLFSGIAMGQEEENLQKPQEVKKGELQVTEEKRYTVKEGDTLWDISGSLMNDPFLWPRLWKDNKYIVNPDLIYPGNILMLRDGEVVIEAAPIAEIEAPKEIPAPTAEVEAAPPVEEEIAAEAVPAQIEEQKERQFVLEGVGVLTDEVLIFSGGFIVPRLEEKGVIIGSWDKKVLLSDNDIIYIDRKKDPSISNNDKYTIYKVVREVKHPATEKRMGYLVKILGVVQITDVKKDVATGRIIRSFDTMEYGDKLMPYKKAEAYGEGGRGSADRKLKGYIVDVKDEKIQNAQLDVVYIDKGTNDGVMIGDRFVVVRPGEKTSRYSPGAGLKLPGQIVGELRVLSVQEKTSTAKIIDSLRTITKGDIIESK